MELKTGMWVAARHQKAQIIELGDDYVVAKVFMDNERRYRYDEIVSSVLCRDCGTEFPLYLSDGRNGVPPLRRNFAYGFNNHAQCPACYASSEQEEADYWAELN
jgi:hypothetical protein